VLEACLVVVSACTHFDQIGWAILVSTNRRNRSALP